MPKEIYDSWGNRVGHIGSPEPDYPDVGRPKYPVATDGAKVVYSVIGVALFWQAWRLGRHGAHMIQNPAPFDGGFGFAGGLLCIAIALGLALTAFVNTLIPLTETSFSNKPEGVSFLLVALLGLPIAVAYFLTGSLI